MGLFVQFGLQNRTIRTKKDAKNAHGAVGVVEAASSSLVTQTNKAAVMAALFFTGGFL